MVEVEKEIPVAYYGTLPLKEPVIKVDLSEVAAWITGTLSACVIGALVLIAVYELSRRE